MIYIHFLTSIVSGVLAIWLLIQNGQTCHPIGILCYVALLLLAYEQFRVVAKRIVRACADAFEEMKADEAINDDDY